MANEFATNFPFNSSQHVFSAIWKLTRVMKKAGWTFKASSDGVSNKSNTVDYWGANVNPLADTYPGGFDGTPTPWIVLEGPATIKIPVTSALNSNFIRGEKVSQATSLAEGELLGHVFDSVGVTGYAVVLARDSITWTTAVITGATSGQTFTPSSTPKKFRRQVVFWKAASSSTDGYVYYICSDESGGAQSTDGLFSSDSTYGTTLYTGATATVAPGGANAVNTRLPTKAIVVRGTLDSGAGSPTPTATTWLHANASYGTVAQIVATNNIPSSSVSPDGTFWISGNYTSPASSVTFFGFFRLDDQEPGDVDPFAWNYQSSTAIGSFARHIGTGSVSGLSIYNWAAHVSATVIWKGYCARGLGGTKDDATYFQSSHLLYISASSGFLTGNFAAGALRVANHPATTPPFVREPVKLFSERTNMKIFKGSVRWMFHIPTGAAYDTADTKTFFVLVSNNGSTNPGIMVGPYDGSTTPTYP